MTKAVYGRKFVLAHGSREVVHNDKEGKSAGDLIRKPANDNLSHRKIEHEPEIE